MTLSTVEIGSFVNALQLSIKTKIDRGDLSENDVLVLNFSTEATHDSNLETFLKVFEGAWNKKHTSFTIADISKYNLAKLTLFLHITRMNEENIHKLLEIDPSVSDIVKDLGLKIKAGNVVSAQQIAQIIFGKIAKDGLTIRYLAEKTGLTQVAISNFKAGGDIKLSNLLKIILALGLKIKIN